MLLGLAALQGPKQGACGGEWVAHHRCAFCAGSSTAGPPPVRLLTQLPGSAQPPAAEGALPEPQWGSAERLCSRPASSFPLYGQVLSFTTTMSARTDKEDNILQGWQHYGRPLQTSPACSDVTASHLAPLLYHTRLYTSRYIALHSQAAAHLLGDDYQCCVVGHCDPVTSLSCDGLRRNQGDPSPHYAIAQAVLALQARLRSETHATCVR